ncbi:MAG: Ppx/GppA family phosphatase [Candidatus Obscuribacterales bacterium]|nr:Ppx/GppA family phosphatase [Candidatus Obscuribacterales bacterium]
MTATSKGRNNKSFVEVYGPPVLACIDMGTNSFHMIVCQASEDRDHFEVITRVREAVPFFRRALTAHTIDATAMTAALRILKDMKTKAAQKGARRLVAVATSAVRESDNGEYVLSQIRNELGLDARMISGREEARLIYLGVLWSMPKLKGRFAIADIGGGSTEIILADRHRTYFTESYKLGAARLTQRFFKKEIPTPQEIRELHDEVRGMLRPAAARLIESGGSNMLIGTSGTVQAIAKLDRARSKKSAHQELDGYVLTLERVEEIVSYLEEASLEGERIKDVSSDRNRTILAGSIVLLETMRSLNMSQLVVCGSALREGVVVDMLLQEGWLEAGLNEHLNPRARSVYSLLEKYQASVEHAEQVADLAFQIFDRSKALKMHNYGETALHLLWSAAMLHDVGMFIGRNGHHKHSYYLIKNGGLLGHSEEEVSLIANIARYHRGSEPKLSHDTFTRLDPNDQQMVSDMAAILRLAEALDRSHRQVVQRVELDLQSSGKGQDKSYASLLIFVRPGESWEPETWALKEKKSFFEKQFQLKLNFEVRTESRPQTGRSGRFSNPNPT